MSRVPAAGMEACVTSGQWLPLSGPQAKGSGMMNAMWGVGKSGYLPENTSLVSFLGSQPTSDSSMWPRRSVAGVRGLGPVVERNLPPAQLSGPLDAGRLP